MNQRRGVGVVIVHRLNNDNRREAVASARVLAAGAAHMLGTGAHIMAMPSPARTM